MTVADILDRLGLRRNGTVTQAAHVLYGKSFLPDYPQSLLKMARFRGTDVTGDILDHRHEHLNAFALVREGIAFLRRNLPISAHFTEGEILREDRLAIPPDALREILLNAVMHRDYSQPGGYVAIAAFDDRVEIRSIGGLPAGITADMLSGPHYSRLRNPLIADVFHRTGAVEIWGRGTNRVISECERYGLEPPTFEEIAGAVVVTIRAFIGARGDRAREAEAEGARAGHKPETGELGEQAKEVLRILRRSGPMSVAAIRGRLDESIALRSLQRYLKQLREAGYVRMTSKGRTATYQVRQDD